MDNRTLQTENVGSFFVITADRDGMRKFVSRVFPRVFQYTTSLNRTQRFRTEELALKFIKGFNDYGKYVIENPEVREVRTTSSLI